VEGVDVNDARVSALMEKVNNAAQRRLAEYTVKRHQIIQFANSLLRYADHQKESYAWEKIVHEIICLWVRSCHREIIQIIIFGWLMNCYPTISFLRQTRRSPALH
jgi:hypothetical protein